MGKIIETKFYCKGTQQKASRFDLSSGWIDNFIEGKWYDGEYELWYDEPEESEKNKERYRLNDRWKSYFVTNEEGERQEVHSSYMKLIFDLDKSNIRNYKIEEILKK